MNFLHNSELTLKNDNNNFSNQFLVNTLYEFSVSNFCSVHWFIVILLLFKHGTWNAQDWIALVLIIISKYSWLIKHNKRKLTRYQCNLFFFYAKHINVTFGFSLCYTLDMKYVCLLIYQI